MSSIHARYVCRPDFRLLLEPLVPSSQARTSSTHAMESADLSPTYLKSHWYPHRRLGQPPLTLLILSPNHHNVKVIRLWPGEAVCTRRFHHSMLGARATVACDHVDKWTVEEAWIRAQLFPQLRRLHREGRWIRSTPEVAHQLPFNKALEIKINISGFAGKSGHVASHAIAG